MIKKGLQNYFKSFKYFFTPLGTMFLGMMLGFSVLIPGIISSANALINGVKELSAGVNLDFNVLANNLWSMVTALDWNNPQDAFAHLFSWEWINEALTQTLNAILGSDFETFKAYIVQLVQIFTANIISYVVVFFTFWILGFIVGYFITGFIIRRNIAKRSLWKFILFTLLNSLLSGVLTVGCAWLFALWKGSILISALLSIILITFIALLEAYLLYAVNTVPFKQIVNIKNMGGYILVSFLIFVISIAFTVIFTLINKILGVFIGLSLIVVAFWVVVMNAESYTQDVVKTETERKNTQKETELAESAAEE